MEAELLSPLGTETIEGDSDFLREFTQCITQTKDLSLRLYIEIKQTPVLESKKHFKLIEDKIAAQKNSIVTQIKTLKKRADELKKKSNGLSLEDKVSFIVTLSTMYAALISAGCKEPTLSFFHEQYADDINMLKQTLSEHIEYEQMSGSSILDNGYAKDMLKVGLYRVYHSYLANSSKAAMNLVFADIMKKPVDFRIVNDFSSERLIAEILAKLTSLLVKIQLERYYNELKMLERLSQNLAHQKQLRGLPLYLTEWFFKVNDRVDLSVYPFKNIAIFILLILTLGLQLFDQYPKFKNSRSFLKFLQHDPGAIYIILVKSLGRQHYDPPDCLQLFRDG